MTEYIILKQFAHPDDQDKWQAYGTAEAQTAKGAIRKAVEGEPGTYVAVPDRSFRPIPVEVETKTSVKFGSPATV